MVIQQEEILKGYDPVLMKRLLAYVKPYLFSAILALTAPLLATTGEMSLPLLTAALAEMDIDALWTLGPSFIDGTQGAGLF